MAITVLVQEPAQGSAGACTMRKSPSAACLNAGAAIVQALSHYGRTAPYHFHKSCSFEREKLASAIHAVKAHLGHEEQVSDCSTGASGKCVVKQLKARWVYCNTPQELAALKALLPDISVEYLFLGVTVHLDTSTAENADIAASVADDVAATFAAIELVLDELAKQSRLRCLRLDINVLVPHTEPFELPACRFLTASHAPVMGAVDRLTGALRELLDLNTAIKTLKLGLHPKLYSMFDRNALCMRRPGMQARRQALLMGKHDRLGKHSGIADVPADLLSTILDTALPLDQHVHVVALRK